MQVEQRIETIKTKIENKTPYPDLFDDMEFLIELAEEQNRECEAGEHFFHPFDRFLPYVIYCQNCGKTKEVVLKNEA